MSVKLPLPTVEQLRPVAGVRLGVASAGIRKSGRKDLLVVAFAPGTQVAGVFTQNAFCAAPVQVCRQHLAQAGGGRAWLVNTGCANAGTGSQGLRDAQQSCQMLSAALSLSPRDILPFSTGVILEHLPMDRLEAGLLSAVSGLGQANWLDAAEAIMTTDTQPKAASRQIELSGKTITITGISKGAGMIRPNMATMLGFVATDAGLSQPLLARLLKEAAEESFNAITIDGDTSTNDSLVAAATGQAGLQFGDADVSRPEWHDFRAAFVDLCRELAQAIVRDGEGATKFMTIRVEEANSRDEARQVAYAVGHSPLVKTAFYASDPNLGRILAAIGYSGVPGLEVERIRVFLNEVLVAELGGRAATYSEAAGQAVMQQDEITIRICLGRGAVQAEVYTCDFSLDYVRINADYRS